MAWLIGMKEMIQKLLDSELSAYRIGKEAGVHDSLVKKLRNGDQTIGDTKYDNLMKLYNYALDKKNILLVNDSKIPKSVRSFIENIDRQLQYTNSEASNEIENVFVYDKYIMDKKGNSIDKVSYIEVSHTLSMSTEGVSYLTQDWIPYKINVQKRIDNKKHIQQFTNLRIIFNSPQLMNDLKKEIILGSKIKIKTQTFFNEHKFKTIYVYNVRDNKETVGYENNYFDIEFDEQNKGGEDR